MLKKIMQKLNVEDSKINEILSSMKETELKTTEAQRKAVREYEKKNDRINVIFPAGTRDRMQAVGVKNPSTFIKEVVAAELERMEKYRK